MVYGIIGGMENYKKSYDAATQKLLRLAAEIDRASLSRFDAQYTLYDIVYVLRNLYADEKFRRKFVGQDAFRGFVPWPKGFCALSSVCIYELYGGGEVWGPSAIKMGAWEHAPVVYLQNKFTDMPFDTTGDQFAPLVVPYHLGEPINKCMRDMKTPNKAEFIKRVKQELDRR